jgi:hypothetical protein
MFGAMGMVGYGSLLVKSAEDEFLEVRNLATAIDRVVAFF